MLQCYGCGGCVHHYCYGLKTPVNDVPNDSEFKLRMFVCDRCRDLGRDITADCAICSRSGKVLKKTSDNKYVHIICALFSNEYRVADFETMEIEPNYNSISLYKKNKTVCDYCEKSNASIQCQHLDCKSVCHVYCAWMNKIDFVFEDEETALGWRMAFLHEANNNTLSLDTLQPRVNDRIEEMYNFVSKPFNGSLENNDINKIREEALKDIRKDVNEGLSYFSEYTESNHIENDVLLSECQEHRNPELFCICKSPYDSTRFMFACDTCENWFHCECLKYKQNRIGELKNYVCKRCQHWAKIRMECFQPKIQVELGSPLETKDPNKIVPKDTRFFWVMDYIITCIIFQRKAFKALSNIAHFKQSLKELLASLKFIPFRIDAMVVNVLSRYYTGLAIDKALKRLFDTENNISPNREDLREEDFNEKKAKEISKTIESLEEIIALYETEEFPKGNADDLVFKLMELNKWKLDFYKQFTDKEKKISLNNIKFLDEGAEQYDIDKNFPGLPERKYLRKFQKSVENWIVGAKDLLQNGKTICQRGKTSKAEKMINEESIGIEKSFDMLAGEIQRLKEDIELRMPLEKIMMVIKQGEALRVEFGESMEELKKEVKKAEILTEVLAKKTGIFDSLEAKISQFRSTFIKLPGADKVVNDYEKAKKVKLRLEYYARICSGEEKVADVDIREVQQMLNDVKELGIYLGKEEKIVKKKLGQIKELEPRIQSSLDIETDLEVLGDLLNEAEAFHIKFSKLDDLKRRIDVVSRIKRNLEKNMEKRSTDSFSDFSKEGFNNGVYLKEEAFEVSDKSGGQIKTPYKANSKPEEMETVDMDSSDENTQFSLLWLRMLIEFYENHSELNHSDDSTHHSGVTNNIENELKRFPLEPLNNENINQIIKNNFREFRDIIQRGINIDLSDQRIAHIFFNHAEVYWNSEICLLFSGTLCLNENDFGILEQLAGKIDNYKHCNDYNKQYKDIFVEYYQWMVDYKAIISSELYTKFLNGQNYSEQEMQSLKKLVSDLLERSKVLKVEVDEEQEALNQALGYLMWVPSAKNLLEKIKAGEKIDYEVLRLLFNEASLLKIPANCLIYSQFHHNFKEQTALKEAYERFNFKRNQVQEKIKQISQSGPARKANILKELSDLSNQKPCLQTALQILKTIRGRCCIVLDTDELSQMEKDINLGLSWQEQAKAFLKRYNLEDNEYLEENKIDEIGRTLNEVTNKMGWLVLQDHQMKQTIHILEWRLHAKLLLNGKERTRSDINSETNSGTAVWKRLLKLADKTPELKLQESQLYKMVKGEIDTYEDLIVKISDIKEYDSFLNEALNSKQLYLRSARKGLIGHLDLKVLTEKLCSCRINAPEASEYLVGLLQKIHQIITETEKLKTKVKYWKNVDETVRSDLQRLAVIDADGLLRMTYTLPVRLDEVEEFLEGCIEGRFENVEKKNEKIKRMQFMEEEEMKKREGVLNVYEIKNQYINEKIDIFDDMEIKSVETQPNNNKQMMIEIQEIPVIEIQDDDIQENQKENHSQAANKETDLRKVASAATVLERNTSAHYNLAEVVDDNSNKRTSFVLEEDSKYPSLNEDEVLGKKIKLQNSVGRGSRLIQSEIFEDVPVQQVIPKTRVEAKQKIMTALRETKKFEGIKVSQREVLTKKFEKNLYGEFQGDQAKYKEKVKRLCGIINREGSNFDESNVMKKMDENIDENMPVLESSQSLPNITLNHQNNSMITQNKSIQSIKRSKSNITSLDSIPESSISNTDKQSDGETPKRVSTRSHSRIGDKPFPMEVTEANSENDIKIKPKRKKNQKKLKEGSAQAINPVVKEDTDNQELHQSTISSISHIVTDVTAPNIATNIFQVEQQALINENAVHPPQYLALCQQQQIQNLASCLPEDKKQKLLAGLSKIPQSFGQNIGTPITHDVSQSPSPADSSQNQFVEPPKPTIPERSLMDSAYFEYVANAKLMRYYQGTPSSALEKQEKSQGNKQHQKSLRSI